MRLSLFAARCVLPSALVLLTACGGNEREATQESQRPTEAAVATPGYAATPRRALEAWVAAVRAGDTEMVCQLLNSRAGCSESSLKNKFLPHVRAEMQGLRGKLRYGAVNVARRYTLIGVVSGESSAAYAVPVARGTRQWSIGDEGADGSAMPIVLDHPDPGRTLQAGSTELSLTVWVTCGSGCPYTELWIDGRRINGRRLVGPSKGYLTRVRLAGTVSLSPGRHVLVGALRGGKIVARAWILTVR